MAKTKDFGDQWVIECPGCGCLHGLKKDTWRKDDSDNDPSFHPSLIVTLKFRDGRSDSRCHSWIKGGRIEFLGDSTHALAGKTVELPDLDE